MSPDAIDGGGFESFSSGPVENAGWDAGNTAGGAEAWSGGNAAPANDNWSGGNGGTVSW